MSIPFIRKYPNNRGTIQHVMRPFEIEQKALDFLIAGGWYTAEITSRGIVKLAATDDKLKELFVLETPNGQELEDTIDRLVNRSVTAISYMSSRSH